LEKCALWDIIIHIIIDNFTVTFEWKTHMRFFLSRIEKLPVDYDMSFGKNFLNFFDEISRIVPVEFRKIF
jgi:hypothetical protein